MSPSRKLFFKSNILTKFFQDGILNLRERQNVSEKFARNAFSR